MNVKTAQDSATFDMSVAAETIRVKRSFTFNGASISFEVDVPVKGETASITVAELHQRSVRLVMEHLQETLPAKR